MSTNQTVRYILPVSSRNKSVTLRDPAQFFIATALEVDPGGLGLTWAQKALGPEGPGTRGTGSQAGPEGPGTRGTGSQAGPEGPGTRGAQGRAVEKRVCYMAAVSDNVHKVSLGTEPLWPGDAHGGRR